jgi:hypothetical protein
MQDLLPHALLAGSLAPSDDIVISLRLRASKAKAFLFSLSADSKQLSVRSIRLRDPASACVVDDVLNGAHVACLKAKTSDREL